MREGDSGEAFGRWLRELRGAMTQEALGRRVDRDQSQVSNAERGLLSEETAARYDAHFAARGSVAAGAISARWRSLAEARQREEEQREEESRHANGRAPTLPEHVATLPEGTDGLAAAPPPGLPAGLPGGRTLALPDGSYRVIASTGEAVVVVIDRRLFTAGAGFAVPLAGMEQARHGLLGSLAADRATADVDEWRQIAWEYGIDYMRTPPAELLGRLQVDLAALGEALRHPHADPAKRELQKVAALLASFAACTVANLGDLRSSNRWWRTARQAADTSGDVHARLWIRGDEVMRALYEQRPMPVVLDLVAEAEVISASVEAPPTALPFLLSSKAQALALVGQAAQAEAALREVRDNFESLPAHSTLDTESSFGFSEHNVRFTESYVYSHLGDFARAEQAQTAALTLYPATDQRRPVMIELQRGLCLVKAGDIAPGVEHAQAVMSGLPRAHHVRPVVDLAHKVLDAVPVAERGRDGVREFRVYLGGHGVA